MSDWAHGYFERGYAQRWGLPPISDQVRLEVEGLSTRLNLVSGSRLVDIGCGHGRHAAALARHGVDVAGVDFAMALLTEAQHLGAKYGVQPHWVRSDMRRLPFRSMTFDAAILIDAFGFFEIDADNEAVLEETARVLAPHGRLCLKVVNGVPILVNFRGQDREEREGTVVTISRTLTVDPPRMIESVTVKGPRGDGRYERRQRLYRSEDMYGILERAGFSIASIYASADGTVFLPTTSAVMWLFCDRKVTIS
jgi:ubiquinone/menaquinone biosynthesis C-methylase UbiE